MFMQGGNKRGNKIDRTKKVQGGTCGITSFYLQLVVLFAPQLPDSDTTNHYVQWGHVIYMVYTSPCRAF